jgi:hypothetical protein
MLKSYITDLRASIEGQGNVAAGVKILLDAFPALLAEAAAENPGNTAEQNIAAVQEALAEDGDNLAKAIADNTPAQTSQPPAPIPTQVNGDGTPTRAPNAPETGGTPGFSQ